MAVTTGGRSAIPASLPGYAAAIDLGRCMECLGISCFFLIGPLLRRTGTQDVGPLGLACLTATSLGGPALAVGGYVLTKSPNEPATVLTGTAVALVIVVALGAWAGVAAKRRRRKHPELMAFRQSFVPPSRERRPGPRLRPAVPLRVRLAHRLRPSNWLPALWGLLKFYLAPTLVILVVLGLVLMAHDAPNARAFRDAPACQGETNLSVCVGDFTATVNGVRIASAGAGSAAISYVTGDGAINAWGGFSGNGDALASTAQEEKTAGMPIRIEVWRGAIVGAEIGGSWHWATGNPPGDTASAVFLAICLILLLLLGRYRSHLLSAASGATWRALLRDHLGQVGAAAAGYLLLIYGYWYGALLVLAALGWMAWRARRDARHW
jgi:hypothetical protein